MKVSASIELVWQLACREAIGGHHEAIEPEHFCMALLKLAELPAEQIGRFSPNGVHVANELIRDAEGLRHVIGSAGFSSTEVRRQLRKALGKGGAAYDGGEMHRSDDSRALFDDAARLADEAGSEALTPEYLFAALIMKPTSLIAQIVQREGGELPIGNRLPGLLAKWGTDLTAIAAKGDLVDASGRAAEAKAILKALQSAKRPGVFLVSDREPPAREAMVALACAAATNRGVPGAKRWRIVDLTMEPAPITADCSEATLLQQVLADAEHVENLAVRVPDIRDASAGEEILTLLRARPPSARPVWICAIDNAIYRQCIQADAHWRSDSTAILLQEKVGQGIPNEL